MGIGTGGCTVPCITWLRHLPLPVLLSSHSFLCLQALPFFKQLMAGWQPLLEPGRGLAEAAGWRGILESEASKNAIFQVNSLQSTTHELCICRAAFCACMPAVLPPSPAHAQLDCTADCIPAALSALVVQLSLVSMCLPCLSDRGSSEADNLLAACCSLSCLLATDRLPSLQDLGSSGVDPFLALLCGALLPAIQSAVTNEWEPRNAEPMVQLVEQWESVWPPALQRHILDTLVLPKVNIHAHKTWLFTAALHRECIREALYFPVIIVPCSRPMTETVPAMPHSPTLCDQ